MPFTDWLLTQAYRSDMVGDFARDASEDGTRPKNGIRVWTQHLRAMRADPIMYIALERAWEEYRIYNILRLTKIRP